MADTYNSALKVVKEFVSSKKIGVTKNSRIVELAIDKMSKEYGWIEVEVLSDDNSSYIRLSTPFVAVGISDVPYNSKTLIKLIALAIKGNDNF